MNKCRCDERLQTKTKEFTRLPYTGLVLELEHLKIETRLIIRVYLVYLQQNKKKEFTPRIFLEKNITLLINLPLKGLHL